MFGGVIFIWLFFVGLMAKQLKLYNIENVNGVIVKRWHWISAVILFFPIFWLACMGPAINDIPMYLSAYKLLPSSFMGILQYLSTMESGQGFVIIEWLIKSVFGNSFTAFRVIIALIHSIPIIYIFRKYSEDYWIAIYLFVASSVHIGWMMNGLRQFIAVAIILFALPYVINRKYMKAIFIILLASTIHVTALCMLPIIFIVQGKVGNKRTMFFIVMAIIAMFILSKNPALMDTILGETEYAGAVTEMQRLGDDGVNPLRVLVTAVPVLLAFVQRRRILREENPVIHICVNMSIITVGFNLIAMVTSGILMGRMAIYTNLYSFIIMPYLIRNAYTTKSQKIVNMLMIVFYFIFYCFEMGVV